MTRIHGFSSLETARRLKRIADQPEVRADDNVVDDIVAWLFITPEDGIDAFEDYENPADDAEVPSALCKAWYLYRDSEADKIRIRKAYGDDGEQLEVRVANLLPEAIPGGKLGRGTQCVGGEILIDWLPCEG